MAENILIAVLGGGNLILFIKFLIERHDKKVEKEEEGKKDDIKKTLNKLEKDRASLLSKGDKNSRVKFDITDKKYMEHYFKVLQGNWYMTSIFNNWLKAENVANPEWFDVNE